MEELHLNDAGSKLQNLKTVISSFSDLLIQENEALEKYDIKLVGQLYDKKAKIVATYRSLVAYFIKNQSELAEFAEEEKKSLQEASQTLNDLIQKNEMLLKTRMEAGKTVMDTIINIAKTANNSNATSYGARGGYSPLENGKNALAINRTL